MSGDRDYDNYKYVSENKDDKNIYVTCPNNKDYNFIILIPTS